MRTFTALCILTLVGGTRTYAQDPMAGMQHQHQAAPSAWHLMQDGVVFLTFNHQGGPRGGDEVGSQNWWMGMARRPAGAGTLTFSLMLSLEPATVTNDGYRELFQVGETLNGEPLVDRQHPHDFLMQAAAVWRAPIGRNVSLTLAGAPVGEPALGPVAFMHRSSASENPTAPLSHHTLDSTHIAMGVLTAAVDRGPWQIETSLFQGREPDENRWDIMDPGPLDSWSVRGWYRPAPSLALQVSHGFLRHPEELEEGDVRRTTASLAWMRPHRTGWTATTIAYGRNDKADADYNAFLVESTHTFGRAAAYGRFETLQVETDLLRYGSHHPPHIASIEPGVPSFEPSWVQALTLGGDVTLARPRSWDVAAGADITMYGVPPALVPSHGDHPLAFHVFVRVRPPAPMGRMMDAIMIKPM